MVDIKLSKKYNPPTNILGINSVVIVVALSCLDTPCTAALHMVARVPDIADAWFAGHNGCFETPQLGVPPKKISIPKLEVGCYLLFELLSRLIYTYVHPYA